MNSTASNCIKIPKFWHNSNYGKEHIIYQFFLFGIRSLLNRFEVHQLVSDSMNTAVTYQEKGYSPHGPVINSGKAGVVVSGKAPRQSA
jgi:hypothetical protein